MKNIGLILNKYVRLLNLNLDYLYYVISSKPYEEYLFATGSGSGQPNLSPSTILATEIPFPDYETQVKIGTILKALDDKIALNRQINQTLEAMAQALFKSWFVDFEPVRAKVAALELAEDPTRAAMRAISGKTDAELDTLQTTDAPAYAQLHTTATLFPDEFEESELGLVPKGWEVKTIKDCCLKIINGGTPRREKKEYWENGTIPWLTSGEVRQKIITKVENFITKAGLENSSAKLIPPYSTVVALYGATAGQVSICSIDTTTNQAVCNLAPKEGYETYNYYAMSVNVQALLGQASGSAQQNISKAIVENTKVLYPEPSVVFEFNKQARVWMDFSIRNLLASTSLSTLRDTLLPKLLSGELTVGEAVEEVATVPEAVF